MNLGRFGAVGAIIAILVGLALVAVGINNRLVGLDEAVDAAWSNVENVYQRRADLIPNLVETVSGAADFERGTLQDVVDARSRVGQVNLSGAPDATQLQQFQAAQDQLSGALSRLLVVVENYPQLRATEGFLELQSQLEGAENRIAVERNRFNEAAQAYNTARRRLPAALFAGMLGFEEKPYFESAPGSEIAPEVDFSDDDG